MSLHNYKITRLQGTMQHKKEYVETITTLQLLK
jgi:hypothetical protein